MKAMKRKLLVMVLVLTMVLFGSVSTIFAEGASDRGGDKALTAEGGKAVRTIMLYTCGADLETSGAMASYNLHQILDANFSADEDVRFIIMTGGSSKWRVNEGEKGEDGKPTKLDLLCKPDGTPIDEVSNVYNQIWEAKGKDAKVNPGKMVLLDGDGITGDGESAKMSKDELMTRPEVLKAFINYCVDNYPADDYDLILWDHGGGPLQGFGVDEHNGEEDDDAASTDDDEEEEEEPDNMTYGGLIDAISHNKVIDSNGDGKQDVDENGDPVRFDFVDFDACLMNTVELNLGLADYMDYYIASPETEPGFGQQYTGWLNTLGNDPDLNAYELGKQIVDDFVDFYEAGYEDGTRQEGTLAVVDMQKLMAEKTGFVKALSGLNEILKDEAVAANFYDELNSIAGSIQYGEMDYFDLGNLVSQISIAVKEIDDTQDDDANRYLKDAQTINKILQNKDIIYARGTSGIRGSGEWYRDVDGDLNIADELLGTLMETSGMYIYFPAPKTATASDYIEVVTEALNYMPKDDRAEFLKSYMCTMMDYNIIQSMGRTVDKVIDDGMAKSKVSLASVKKVLDVPFDKSVPDVTEWSTSYGKLLDLRDGVADDYIENEAETLAWLDKIIKMQAEDAVAKSNISVANVEMKDGTGYKVTISDIHKRAVEAVQTNLVAELPVAAAWIKANPQLNGNEAMKDLLLGDEEGFVIGSKDATTDFSIEDFDNYSKWYNSTTASWNIRPIEQKTYAVKDANGKLHVGEIEEEDGMLQMIATIPDESGDGKEDLVVLYFRDDILSSIMYVDPRKRISPSQLMEPLEVTPIHYVNFLGLLTYNIPVSTPFTVTDENYLNIKPVYTDVSNIPDIADTTGDGKAVHDQFVVLDIYDHPRDFTDIAKASTEKLTDLELARIKPVYYNGEVQAPEVICNGRSLVEGVDYRLYKASEDDVFQEIGEYNVQIEGMGKYTGFNMLTFNIVQEEFIAEALVIEAEVEYEAAEKAYMEVLASEESDLAAVKAALSRLHNAEKLLNDAKDELKRIKDIFSAEEMAQANDKIIQLQEKVAELEKEINKKANPLNVKGKTATVKYSKLKKKAQTLALSRVIKTVKKGAGTVTYTKGSVSNKKFAKKFTVNKKSGKITIKKGVKKGTYKIKIKVKAAGNDTYKAGTKTVTVKVKVK